jgi:predicted ferric reductase
MVREIITRCFMSSLNPPSNESSHKHATFWVVAATITVFLLIFGVLGFVASRFYPVGQLVSNALSFLFATNSTHTTWYITRAASWVAYMLLWFSVVWGLVIPTKFLEKLLSPTFVVDFHEYLSLLAIGFVILHVSVLMVDQYLPFTLAQVLFPFISPYRPFWVGLGVIGAYLSALVTITFYLRKRIGQKRFKQIHIWSMAGYLGVVLHAFFSGSDSSLLAAQLIYFATFMVVVFLTSYWLINLRQMKKDKEARALASHASQTVRR